MGAQGPMGTAGEDGMDGMNGTNGTNGTNGSNGSNGLACWDLNGNGACDMATEDIDDDNACDVADCAGPPGTNGAPGTTGQMAASVFGTSTLLLASDATATLVPGLTQTVTVPANAITVISSDGGLVTDGIQTTDFSLVDIAVAVDGTFLTNGGYQQLRAANTTGTIGSATWGFTVATPLAAGSHTIAVFAIGKRTSGQPTTTISGGTGNVNQATLTVMFLKQ